MLDSWPSLAIFFRLVGRVNHAYLTGQPADQTIFTTVLSSKPVLAGGLSFGPNPTRRDQEPHFLDFEVIPVPLAYASALEPRRFAPSDAGNSTSRYPKLAAGHAVRLPAGSGRRKPVAVEQADAPWWQRLAPPVLQELDQQHVGQRRNLARASSGSKRR